MYASLMEGNGRDLRSVAAHWRRGVIYFGRLLVLLNLFGSRKKYVRDCIETSELPRNEDAVNTLDSYRILNFFFYDHQPQESVHRNESDVPGIPRPPYLGFKVAGVLPSDHEEHR